MKTVCMPITGYVLRTTHCCHSCFPWAFLFVRDIGQIHTLNGVLEKSFLTVLKVSTTSNHRGCLPYYNFQSWSWLSCVCRVLLSFCSCAFSSKHLCSFVCLYKKTEHNSLALLSGHKHMAMWLQSFPALKW